ncbi:hypothetical protein BDZ91DRAFT_738214 [Kalaharituber pfeilii]|nr:hypothetical protein BDZ91DRAFT_738214 [Kalaharituber pfeilii]
MTSTPPPATNNTHPPATATPAAAAQTPGPTGSAPKRRPYEDPTDGERYQLYVHSRAHPELKQKDLVTWFAQNFGKEINQSTVSRALKRYRDNPPENPESAGMAKSKRGGGGGAASSPAAGGSTIAVAGVTTVAQSGGEVEEEAARADEQVQRENQQGIGRNAAKADGTAIVGEQEDGHTVRVVPYQQAPQRGQQQVRSGPQPQAGQHHHHTMPPTAVMHHVLPHPLPQATQPGQPGQPPHGMQGQFHAHGNHVNHVSTHAAGVNHNHFAAPGLGASGDIDSDSDMEGALDAAVGNGMEEYGGGSWTSEDAELTALHKRYEVILMRSFMAGQADVTADGQQGEGANVEGGEGAASQQQQQAQQGGAATSASQAGAGGAGRTDVTQHPTLSRESLVMYLVGRNELVRSLQMRVAEMEREIVRLRRKVKRGEEVIGRLKRGEGV